MRVTSNQYSDAVSNMVKRKIYSDLSMQLTNEIVCSYPSPFLVSIPVGFTFLNVLVLNIAEKLLAGR
jgi:hypothetical protein